MDEFEDVFYIEGDVVNKEDCYIGVKVIRGEGERVESLVAEDGEGFYTVDTCAGFRVDIISSKVVGNV